ncbi:MAG TPA: hypothetical protein VGI66_03365 [Streptosporangiaceae bacterium]|jgi:hypothetical protein
MHNLADDGQQNLSFRQWLRQFAGEESAIGDLARDVRDDPRPPGGLTLRGWRASMKRRGASYLALQVLERAWARYEAR